MPEPKSPVKHHLAIGACIVNLPKNIADEVQIFPCGEFSTPLGSMLGNGPWRLNTAAAKQLIAAVAVRKNDILVDYEHQSLSASQSGHKAPAAAWLKTDSLVWRDGEGLFAIKPDWKAAAATLINADEYRYLSPVFIYNETTGEPENIISVALTNTPAIDNMLPVSLAAAMAGFANSLEPTMNEDLMERLRYLLNLPLTTTPEEMLAELDKLKAMLAGEGQAIAAASLPELITLQQGKIATLSVAEPDPAKYVPIAALLAVQQQAGGDAQIEQNKKIAALIAANPAVITPPLVAWATRLGQQGLAELEDYIAKANPIAALTMRQTDNLPDPGQSQAKLAQEEKDVCQRLGLTEADYLATKTG
jgi:phage I-like protein